MFFKIGVLKNFAIFTGKDLYWSLFLKKLQAFRFTTLLKRGYLTGAFLWIFWNFSEQLFCRKSGDYFYERQIVCVHCLKSVRIRSFSVPFFPVFGLNTERYSLSFCIQSECGKIRTRKTPNTETLLAAVRLYRILSNIKKVTEIFVIIWQ